MIPTSFSIFVSDLIIEHHENVSLARILCGILLSIDKNEVANLQKKFRDNYLLLLVTFIYESADEYKIKNIQTIIDSSADLVFAQALSSPLKNNLKAFICNYGITPLDCYLSYFCEMGNTEMLQRCINKGAKRCNNCFNIEHTDDPNIIYRDIGYFICKHREQKIEINQIRSATGGPLNFYKIFSPEATAIMMTAHAPDISTVPARVLAQTNTIPIAVEKLTFRSINRSKRIVTSS